MKKLDFYEFAGTLAPGAITLYGLSLIYPSLGMILRDEKMNFGELGLLLILGYVAGHFVQSIGIYVEGLWWKTHGGWPSDWVRRKTHGILAEAQWKVLPNRMRELLRIECPDNLSSITEADWQAMTRQVYACARKFGRTERVDIFNGDYGMFRGLAASLLIILAATLVNLGNSSWLVPLALGCGVGLALLRMHRFGMHYAQELFVQFIEIQPSETQAEHKKED